jgi:hypothetical protein
MKRMKNMIWNKIRKKIIFFKKSKNFVKIRYNLGGDNSKEQLEVCSKGKLKKNFEIG